MKPAAVFSLDSESAAKAGAIAREFGLPHIEAERLACASNKDRLRFFLEHLSGPVSIIFVVEADVLQLALIDAQGILLIRAGFHEAALDYRREKGGGRSEMIAKAVGLKGNKPPCVIDATAGLGVDAFVLASIGCQVSMVERVAAVNALLADGLERSTKYAEEQDAELAAILARMKLVQADAHGYLKQIEESKRPDVVYLDPMFPERRKSAAVKKEMQVFHKLIGPDADADQVLEAALRVARHRVVVKRPRIAAALEGPKPSHALEGTRNRYDVYLKPKS